MLPIRFACQRKFCWVHLVWFARELFEAMLPHLLPNWCSHQEQHLGTILMLACPPRLANILLKELAL
jgi:hypothetical protein